MNLLSLLLTNVVFVVDWVTSTDLNAGECLSLGFNSAKLLCSSCDHLKQFSLGDVVGECRGGCNDDGGSATLENVKYERAVLEVCG